MRVGQPPYRRTIMKEYVLVVRSHDDGEVYCVVTPSDPLNPQYTIDEIQKRLPDAIIDTEQIITLTDFIEYDDAMLGDAMSDVPPSGSTSHA
jgi:hypothetical protein